MSFGKKNVSVCQPDFFESADARDLGLMTLFSLSFLLSLFQSSYISLFFSFSTTFLCVCASLALPPPPHPLPHLALSTSHPRNSLSLNSLFSLRHSTHTNLFTSLLRLLFFPFSHDDDFRYGTTTKTTTRFIKNPPPTEITVKRRAMSLNLALATI